jgi:DNA processing protein
MNQTEREARLSLSLVKGVGPHKFLQYLEYYGSAKNFWQSGFGHKFNIPAEIEILKKVNYLVLGEEDYPQLLAQINDPPPVLFYAGNPKLDWQKAIAIVGTRRTSIYGQMITRKLVSDLVKNDYLTVSGLAYGIDTIVHKQTLLDKGKTVAVLATAINNPYPKLNYQTYKEIINSGGLVLSEFYFPQSAAVKGVFPRRNRIVAGLAGKTVITEAPLKSGALITANLAFHYNREVFAVPGNVNSPTSAGCNWLIQNEKARLICGVGDIIPSAGSLTAPIQLSVREHEVLELVRGLGDLNKIIEESKLPTEIVIGILTELELKEIIVKDLIDNYTVIV